MIQAAAATPDPLRQLLAQCRDQPIVFDDVRAELCASLEQVILDRMQRPQDWIAQRRRMEVGRGLLLMA